MKKLVGCLVVGMMLFFSAQLVFSQTSQEYRDLKKELDSLKEGQEGIKKDIQEIKKLVQSRPAAGAEFKEAIINIKSAPILGDKNAKLVLIEFSDYQ